MKKKTALISGPASGSSLKGLLSSLNALKEANLELQQRLAEEVRRSRSKEELEILEGFLDSFLNNDLHITLLRSDLRAQEEFVNLVGPGKDTMERQRQLQRDVGRMCDDFGRLKAEFETHFRKRA